MIISAVGNGSNLDISRDVAYNIHKIGEVCVPGNRDFEGDL
jgi:hypothetical protein